MDSLLTILKGAIQFPLRHKWKILALPLIAIMWIFVIFPYEDLRGFISGQVSKAMPGAYFNFENLSLGLGAPIAVILDGVEFERPGTPAIKAERIYATPAFTTLLGGLPGGSAEVMGLFEGSLNASFKTTKKPGKAEEQPVVLHELKGSLADLELRALTTAMKRAGTFGSIANGKVSSEFDVLLDPSFKESPGGNISISGALEIPAMSIPLPGFGPLQLPSIKFEKLNFKGRLQEGTFAVEELVFGQPNDVIFGRARGKFGIALSRDGNRVNSNLSDFDLNIELGLANRFQETPEGGLLGGFLAKFKQPTAATEKSSKFRFRLQAPNLGVFPKLSESTGLE